jgi:hypothetical protein
VFESVKAEQGCVLDFKLTPKVESFDIDEPPTGRHFEATSGKSPIGQPFRPDLPGQHVLRISEDPLKVGMGLGIRLQVPEDFEEAGFLPRRRVQRPKFFVGIIEPIEPGAKIARGWFQRGGDMPHPPQQIPALQNQISANCCAAGNTASRSWQGQ